MRDFWAIVSGVAGVLAVVFAVVVYMQSRAEQSKNLDVELIARSTLVDERVSGSSSSLKLMYDGRVIANYAIVQLRVSNTGGQPVRATDYEETIRLQFDNVQEVLSAKEISSEPAELDVPTEIMLSEVVLANVLLNPGDSYIIDIRVVPRPGLTPVVKPIGRIAGVKRLRYKETLTKATSERAEQKDQYRKLTYVQSAVMLLLLAQQFLWWRRRYRS